MKLLDTFCGGGGCTKGYQRAGFYVVGVDIKPQPHYCGDEFYQADALEFIREHGGEYDVIHASPPCQRWSDTQPIRGNEHPDLITPLRPILEKIGRPWVIENVSRRTPLVAPFMLCGKTFDLKVYRHRYFEVYPFTLLVPPHIRHRDSTPKVGRGASPKGFVSIAGKGGWAGTKQLWARAMGIDWMTLNELAQAIPPAYTEWIGRRLLELLG